MRRSAFALLLTLGFGAAAFGQTGKPMKFHAYFGGYTGGKSGGKGIMLAEFDAASGKLGAATLAAEIGSPSFLCLHPNGETLYAVGEGGGKDGGPVVAFAVTADGKLTEKNVLPSGGSGPCHLSTDAAGKFLAVANYGGGSTAVFALNDDGSLKARTAFVQHVGSGPDKARQTGPHGHCCFFDETGEFVLTADLGLDKVLVHKLNRADGTVAPAGSIDLPPGSGPRHFHIAPGNKVAYICGEMNGTVNVATLDFAAKAFPVTQSLSTLPEKTPGNSTAECRLHPNGKFVYVSNRGHDSIAAFKLTDGKLTAIGHAKGAFKVPRNFNIDPTGKWMLVAGQASNNVEVFSIGEDGLPKATGTVIDTPAPVCIKFLAK